MMLVPTILYKDDVGSHDPIETSQMVTVLINITVHHDQYECTS
jgi:hypothetical protein